MYILGLMKNKQFFTMPSIWSEKQIKHHLDNAWVYGQTSDDLLAWVDCTDKDLNDEMDKLRLEHFPELF